jgi:putative membrane protein insertion efficiency factor
MRLQSREPSSSDRKAAARAVVRLWRGVLALPALAGRALVKAYRYTFSPLVGFHCRHLPTCSDYADQALQRFGLWAGGWMTLARLLRCHPFGTSGLDFVPDALAAGARWYLPWRYGRWHGTNAPDETAAPDRQPKAQSPASPGEC